MISITNLVAMSKNNGSTTDGASAIKKDVVPTTSDATNPQPATADTLKLQLKIPIYDGKPDIVIVQSFVAQVDTWARMNNMDDECTAAAVLHSITGPVY